MVLLCARPDVELVLVPAPPQHLGVTPLPLHLFLSPLRFPQVPRLDALLLHLPSILSVPPASHRIGPLVCQLSLVGAAVVCPAILPPGAGVSEFGFVVRVAALASLGGVAVLEELNVAKASASAGDLVLDQADILKGPELLELLAEGCLLMDLGLMIKSRRGVALNCLWASGPSVLSCTLFLVPLKFAPTTMSRPHCSCPCLVPSKCASNTMSRPCSSRSC